MPSLVSRSSLRVTTALNVLLGLWLFISPWIYRSSNTADSWNSCVFAVFIVAFAAIRYGNPEIGRSLSVLNMLFGAWIFASPWVFKYPSNTSRVANDLIVGAAIFVLGAYGSGAVARTGHHREARL